jgi:cytochrome c-type biogenesis protein CcmE
MRSQFRFFFVVFYVVAVLIFTVYLHRVNDRIFYRLCAEDIEQNQLKQQLWQKQLQVEGLINPAALSQRLEPQTN